MVKTRLSLQKKRKFDQKRFWQSFGIFTIAAILIAAIFIVLNFQKLQGDAAHNVQEAALHVNNAKQKHKPSFNYGAVKPVSPASLANAYAHRRDYRAIGQVAIPKWNIDMNIYQGVGNVELNLGAGTMTPNQMMGVGNYCLAAHNMDDGVTYFSPLYSAKVRGWLGSDTTIMLTDYKKVYYYKVTQSTFITRYRTDLLQDKAEYLNKPVVSLFTCDATGAGRLFVRGKLTGYQSLKSASQYVQKAFLS